MPARTPAFPAGAVRCRQGCRRSRWGRGEAKPAGEDAGAPGAGEAKPAGEDAGAPGGGGGVKPAGEDAGAPGAGGGAGNENSFT